jgi:DNA primase
MTRFTESEIEEVRSRADIVEVIGAHVRLRRTGRNFVGLCPFHNEKTASFTVNLERGFFHCFGCGVGGSVFDFLMKIEGLTFPEALQSLAQRYGIKLPDRTALTGTGPGRGDDQRSLAFAANEVAAEFYSQVLWNTSDGEVGRDYLKARGITGETARAFMLGFAPPRAFNLVGILHKRGLLEAALRVGLAKRDESGTPHDMFRGRLMFPIRDVQGRVIAFGGRVLDSRLPKYINSPESPLYSKARALYGLTEARSNISKADRVIIVEGYIDVIALWQSGFKETVATLGTALTIEQLRLLSRYSRNILACFDGDEAGRKASLRALDMFLQAGLLGRGVFIPQGHDPDTLVRQRGSAHFEDLLARSELLVEMFLKEQGAFASKRRASSDERTKIVQVVTEKLRMISDEVQFNVLVRKAVELVGFTAREEASIREMSRRHANKLGTTSREALKSGSIRLGKQHAEIALLAIALTYPELREEICAAQPFDSFEDESLAKVLLEVCGSPAAANELAALVTARVSQEKKERLAKLLLEEPPNEASDTRLSENQGAYFQSPKFREYFEPLLEKEKTAFEAPRGIDVARQKVNFFLRILADPAAEVAQLRSAASAATGQAATIAAQNIILARQCKG